MTTLLGMMTRYGYSDSVKLGKIAVFDYTNVIFAALLGCLFLGQSAPDAITILGFAVIIAMALLINARR